MLRSRLQPPPRELKPGRNLKIVSRERLKALTLGRLEAYLKELNKCRDRQDHLGRTLSRFRRMRQEVKDEIAARKSLAGLLAGGKR